MAAPLLLLLLATAGMVSSLQYPLQYHYHYRARLAMGIPGINDKHTGAADLRADLIVRVTSPTRVVFQMTNVETATHNGDLPCDGDGDPSQPLPGGYQPLSEEALPAMVGANQFAIIVGTDNEASLVLQQDESSTLANVYRSIVAMFLVEPLRSSFMGQPPARGTASGSNGNGNGYTVMETSAMGNCSTMYTQHELRGVEVAKHQHFVVHHVTDDVQESEAGGQRRRRRAASRKGGKGGRQHITSQPERLEQRAPALDAALWQYVRSINLDDCNEPNNMQSSSAHCSVAGVKCSNPVSRSSVGHYIVRGGPGGRRIEKVTIKGAFIINPSGSKNEHMQSITTQRLALVSVRHLDSDAPAMTSATKTVSLYMQPVEYFSGVLSPDADSTANGLKESIRLILSASQLLRSSTYDSTIYQLSSSTNYAAYLLSIVPLDALQAFVRDFPKDDSLAVELMHDLLGTTGSVAGVRVFLQEVEEGRVSALRQVLFFATISVNMHTTSVLRPLLDFVAVHRLDEQPWRSSQSLVNLASAVHRHCVAASHHYRQSCVEDNIVADLTHLITEQLEGTNKFWKEMVLVQSLVNLRSREAINLLLPFVLGARPCDSVVRVVALSSLSAWHNGLYNSDLQDRDKMTDILLTILENPSEKLLMRSRALGFLVSWPLTASIWNRLALSTWHPSNRELAGFTYSIIKTTADYHMPELAQQSLYAQYALGLAKPSSAHERRSSYDTWVKHSFQHQFSSIKHVAMLTNSLSLLPQTVSLFMQRTLGGIMVHAGADMLFSGFDGSDWEAAIMQLFLNRTTTPYNTRNTSSRAEGVFRQLKSGLHIDERMRGRLEGLVNLFTTTDIQLFIPLDYELLYDMMASISSKPPYLEVEGGHAVFIRPVNRFFHSINDLGLFSLCNDMEMEVWYRNGSLSIHNSGPMQYRLSSQDLVHSVVRTSLSQVYAIVPWVNSGMIVAVLSTSAVKVPLSVNAELKLGRSLEVTVSAPVDHVGMLGVNRMPYTIFSSLQNVELNRFVTSFKLLRVLDFPQLGDHRTQSYWNHFLNTSVTTDFKFDLGPDDIMGLLTKRVGSMNTVKFMAVDVAVDFTRMPWSSCHLNITTAHVDRLQDVDSQQEEVTFDQQEEVTFDQQEEDFEEFSELDASTGEASQEVEDLDSSRPHLTAFLHRLRHTKQWHTKQWHSKQWRGRVDGVEVRGTLAGSGTKEVSMGVVVAWMAHPTPLHHRSEHRVAAYTATSFSSNPMCMEGMVNGLLLSDMDTLESIDSKNLYSFFDFYFFHDPNGGNFPDLLLLTLTVSWVLTEAEAATLLAAAANDCDGSPADPMQRFLDTAQYNKLRLSIHFDQPDSALTKEIKRNIAILEGFRATVLGSQPVTRTTSGHSYSILTTRSGKEWSNRIKFNGEERVYQGVVPPQFVSDTADRTPTCIVSQQSVDSFDGLHTIMTLGKCAAMAATSCEQDQDNDFAVAVRKRPLGGLLVDVSVPGKHLTVSINGDGVWYNGEMLRDDPSVSIMTHESLMGTPHFMPEQQEAVVRSHNGTHKLDVFGYLVVILKQEKLYIKLHPSYHGFSCGLCGDHDNEPSNDMKSPEGCLLHDGDAFQQSWVASSTMDCYNTSSDNTSSDNTNNTSSDNTDSCLKEQDAPSHDYYHQYRL